MSDEQIHKTESLHGGYRKIAGITIDQNTTRVLQTVAALGAITVMVGNWIKAEYREKHSNDPVFSSVVLQSYKVDPPSAAIRFVTMRFSVVKARKCYVSGMAPVQWEIEDDVATVETEPIMRMEVSKVTQPLILKFSVPYVFKDHGTVTIMPVYDCGKYNIPHRFGPYKIEAK